MALRELIWGSQPSQIEQEEQESALNESNREDHRYKPLGQVYSSLPKKRKSISSYSRFPEVSGSKRIQTFPPGYYSFNKFQQYERPPQRINREILRSLWHQACYGGDVDAAVRILVTMIQVDSIDFSDFHQFLLLLRTHSSIPSSTLSSIAFTAVSMKITSSKSKTVKSLLEMFLEMLITHSDPKPKSTNNSSSVVNRALDLLNRFILNPSITGDYSLESMLTLFYCLQAIELCRSLLLEGQNDRPLHPTRSLSERDSYERRKKHQKTLVTTLLKEANVNNILLLAPSSAEICSRPLLFAQTISTLRLYDAKYTKKFGIDRRVEIRRILQDIGNHFDRLFRLQEENSSISADFSLLYASYLIGSKRDAEANDIFSSQVTQNARRGRRTYLHFLALTSPHDSRGIVSAARKLLIPQMIPEGSCPSTSRIQPEPEDLVCACYLYSLGQMTDNEFISLMANALESSFPTILRLKSGQQRCSCNIDVIFSTNFDPFHHSLWANLANVLGPWHPSEKADGGIDINTLHEQIGSEKLKSEYGLLTTLPTDPITLDYIRNYTFDMQYFETAPKHQAHFIDLFDEEAAVTPISPCNQSLRPPETSVNHPSPAQVSSIPAIVQSFRSERKWWTKAGHPFSNSFLGDELSWSVMEFVAKKMILAALKRHSNPPRVLSIENTSNLSYDESIVNMTKLKTEFLKPIKQDSDTSPPNNVGVGDSSDFDSDDSSDLCSQTSSVSDAWGPAPSTTPLKDSYPISSEDDDDEPTQPATSSEPIQQVVPNEDPNTSLLFPESLWKNFLSWCRFESSPASSSVYSGEISSDAFGPFDIKKVRYDVTTGAPLWKLIGRVFSLRNYSKGPNEKIVHYLLGEKLLEILAYQILVYCHLTGSFSDIWVCRAVQVLIQQGEESPAALRCLAYLVSMGIDILDIVRQGNTLVGLGTDIHVKSSDPIDAPGEQILHCTSNSSYIPL